ncbi:MAG: MBL fold metallo-hydrolase [Ginsengibacter sp.]
MKITYLGHATLLIEIDGTKILSDPWLIGPAYCGQWYLFPQPPENALEYLQDVDYIFVSHGHEDHLHYETLKKVNKSAHIFFPYTWYAGAVELFRELGFEKITEAVNEQRYHISKNISVTFLANNLDNVVVVESKDKTLVNINDALPSAPQGIIAYFIKKITSKWPTVDYLFSSYGGASYFPNTIKCEWKNDMETGAVREQFFLDNFCKIAKGINATFSIPFAGDFVLLDDSQRWINKVKVPRGEIKNYFNNYFSHKDCATQIIELYPGDVAEDGKFFHLSGYHEKFKHYDLASLAEQEYKKEIVAKKNIKKIAYEEFENIYQNIKKHVKRKFYIVPPEKRKQLKFAVQITDSNEEWFIEIDLREEEPLITLAREFNKDNLLLLKIKSRTILYSLSNEWGGDAIIIGYGCEINIFSMETIREQLENYAIQLLTNYPNTKEYIKQNPFRAFNYLAHDKIKRKIFLNKIVGKKASSSPFTDERLGDKELWLTRTNCEICRRCNLPVLTESNTTEIY